MIDKEGKLKRKLGQLIKVERQKKNMSLEQLAEKADLDSNNISRIERGKTSPTLLSLIKLVSALDLHQQADFLTKLVHALHKEES